MDISKLPKLSDTKGQEAEAQGVSSVEPAGQFPSNPQMMPEAASPTTRNPYSASSYPSPVIGAGIGADIWISLIIGLLLCMWGQSFAKFSIAKITHHQYHTDRFWPVEDPKGRAGQEVDYFDLDGDAAWSDMGIFLFGAILLFDAASKTAYVLRPGKPARYVLRFAIGLTALGIILNLVACARLFGDGTLPLISGFAVAFGGWIFMEEMNTLRRMKPLA